MTKDNRGEVKEMEIFLGGRSMEQITSSYNQAVCILGAVTVRLIVNTLKLWATQISAQLLIQEQCYDVVKHNRVYLHKRKHTNDTGFASSTDRACKQNKAPCTYNCLSIR